MDVHSRLSRCIARLLVGVLLLNPLLVTAAELSVDGAAGGNTAISQAANGVPIVNIATPNSSGLSHNRFTEFNVATQGLILNNATGKFTETQLGGVILGNSNLNGRAAGVILNEVTGSNPSQLKGYTEVAGQSAHVIVANPHGITCDGCGFINTPRATLSTGVPVIADGQLRHFAVDGGQIVIDGTGLNAANIDQFDLITRVARLNAALYAERINVILGRNEVDADTLAAIAALDDGSSKPLLALDSSAIGGMYAGAIRLIGTEKGVGFNMPTDMAASSGDFDIDVNGKLTIKRVVTAGELRARAAEILLAGKVHADGNVRIESAGAVEVTKALTSAADVSIKASSLTNLGTLGGAGSVQLEMPVLVNQGGLIFSGQDMALKVDSFTNLAGDVYSLGDLAIVATEQIDNRSGSLESADNLSIQAKRILNQRDVLTTRQEKYAARITELPCSIDYGAGDCDGGKEHQVWKILERDRLLVTEASAASFITAGGNLSLMGESLLNHASAISAAGDMTIKVNTLSNIGVQPGEYESSRVFLSSRTRDPENLRDAAASFNRLYGSQTEPAKGLENGLNNFVGAMEQEQTKFRTSTATKVDAETYSAVIQAGGKVEITTQDSFDSSVVRPTYGYVAGGNLGTTSASGSDIATAISHNPQLSPDTTHQATLPGFTLPPGSDGLFQLNSDGTHRYLVETNPAFASLRGFISSDYLLNIIGYNQDVTQRRLGDGLYEQRLIQQAIVARTGKRFLDGLTSDEAQFKYLMDNAVASKQALQLVPGIALTAEQVAALTHDIVWMQEQEVAGQKVLVPVLYLAQAKDRLAPTGALIQGQDVALISGKELNNSGTLRAANDLSVSAQNINNSGLMQADKTVSLLATDSIRNTQGGLIVGADVSAIALTGDIVNERTVTTHKSTKQGFERREDFVDSAAGFEASNSLTLSAGRDLINQGGNLSAGGDANLSAGRDLVIASQRETDSAANRDKKGHANREQVTQHGSTVQVGGDLNANAGRDLAIIASTVKASGDIQLSAEQDLTIASAANQSSSDSYRKSSGKKVTAQSSTVRQQSAVIEAGGDLDIEAGNNLVISASQLKAGNEAFLYAGNQLTLLSAEDSDHSLYDKQKKGSWGKKETRKDETTSVRNVGTTIESGTDLSLVSEGDQLYQTATLKSGADLTLDSGGAITFEAVKDLEQQSHERSKNSWAWTSAKGEGTTDETLRQSHLIAQGETIIRAVDGLRIDIKQIDQKSVSQTINAMVAADPSLAWIKEAEQRGDVDWRRVKEVHDSWDYDHSALGGPAAMAIAIIVTYLTWGAGSSLIGVAANSTAGLAANSVASAVAVNAATSTINNQGNLGAVLKNVTSADSLKGYAVAGVSAGIGGQSLGLQLAVNSALETVTSGGDFKDNLLKGALQLAANALSAGIYKQVGDSLVGTNIATKTAVHAIVGGLIAEAAGGDFKTAALAAGASQALLDLVGNKIFPGDAHDRTVAMTSQLIGVVVASAAGGSEKDQEVAGWVAQQATVNNYLNHEEVDQLAKEVIQCRVAAAPSTCRSEVVQKYQALNDAKTGAILYACKASGEESCNAQLSAVYEGSSSLDRYLSLLAFSAEEKDLLQKFQDLNHDDERVAYDPWRQSFLQESGVIGGVLVGGAAALASAQRAAAATNSALSKTELIASLPPATKISPEGVIDIRQLRDGRVVWLENGSDTAGLQHILKRHEVDFTNKGIRKEDIANVVMNAIENGKIIGRSGSAPVYRVSHNGVEQNIAIGVGSNGFIIRANPVRKWSVLP